MTMTAVLKKLMHDWNQDVSFTLDDSGTPVQNLTYDLGYWLSIIQTAVEVVYQVLLRLGDEQGPDPRSPELVPEYLTSRSAASLRLFSKVNILIAVYHEVRCMKQDTMFVRQSAILEGVVLALGVGDDGWPIVLPTLLATTSQNVDVGISTVA